MTPFEEFKQNIGVMAEVSLLYFRHVINSGGSPEEAERLTRCFMTSMMEYGNNTGGEK